MSRKLIATLIANLFVAGYLAAQPAPAPDRFVARSFDIVFRDATVIDGSGAPARTADVGVIGDEIAAIGDLSAATGARELDLAGRHLAPGFIDIHTHLADGEYAQYGLLSDDRRYRAAPNYVSQGITTALVNPDGAQHFPLDEQQRRLERGGIGLNVAMTNGHNGLRAMVMAEDPERPATGEEIVAMRDIVLDDLRAGRSFGLSVGTEYYSGAFSNTEEQVELARALAPYNGIFIGHMRSQGDAPMWYRPSRYPDIDPPTLDDAMDELFAVARQTGAVTVMTHMKAWGSYRGRAGELMARVQKARDAGDRIFIDVYPYSSSGSDGAFSALPRWAFGVELGEGTTGVNFAEALEKTLADLDAAGVDGLRADVKHEIAMRGGPDNIRILDFPKAEWEGRTFGEVMAVLESDALETAIAMQRAGDPMRPGGGRLRSISMAEEDIETFLAQPWAATSTDGWVVLPEEAVGDRKYANTHRRCFGSFPRRLAHFAHERGVGTLEEAVRSITSLPAEILSLADRGRLAVGMKADLVVFDLARLADNTTYVEPSVYPSGIDHVLVNGYFVVDGGERTLALPGVVLER